ncbi:MAG: SpaA isopeptide-forming pilin-related protein [Ancrocorticia sp.]
MNRHDFTVMWSRRFLALLAILTLFASTVFGMGESALASPAAGDDIVLDEITGTASDVATSLIIDGGTEAPTSNEEESASSGGDMGNGAASSDKNADASPSGKTPVDSGKPLDAKNSAASGPEEPGMSPSEEPAGSQPEDPDAATPNDPANSDEPEEQDGSESQDNPGSRNESEAQSDPQEDGPQTFAIGPQAAGQEPIVLFEEDFENGWGSGAFPRTLTDYTGKSGTKYTASSYWRDRKYCNGFITSAMPNIPLNQVRYTYCGVNGGTEKEGDYNAVRNKAFVLGKLRGMTDAQAAYNHALSTNTSGGTPDHEMFRTQNNNIPIGLPRNSRRFIAFSVDSADTHTLGATNMKQPEMYFSLLQGSGGNLTRTLLNSTPLPVGIGSEFSVLNRPPVNSTQAWASQGLYGTYYSESILLPGDSNVGILLENKSTASSVGCGAYNPHVEGWDSECPAANKGIANGNDGAIDNIRVLDVSPTTEKSFSPSNVRVGTTSTMTITVRNRDDLQRKDGWQFTDTLPAGLKFANSTVGGTCRSNSGSNITADVSTGRLTVTRGILNKGQESCTIVTTVTSDQATTFTNGGPNGNFSGLAGIDAPNNAQVTFYPLLTLQKNIVSRHNAGDQFTLTITPSNSAVTGASATTTGSTTGVQSNRIAGPVELRAGVQYTLRETGASGANLANYQSSLACVDTVNANASIPVTPVSGTPGAYTLVSPQVPSAGSVNVVCTFMNQRIPDPKLTLVKTVENPAEGSGYAVVADWTLTATGTGDVQGTTISGKTGDSSVTGATVKEGRYDLSETFATTPNKGAGYNWTDVVCRDASNNVISTSKSEDASSGTSVVTNASVALERGDDVTCTFTNTPKPGSVTWTKTAEGKSDLLANSEWTLTGPGVTQGGAQVEDCTSGDCAAFLDKDPAAGKFKLTGLTWGTYSLTETKAPAGYYLLEDPVTFTVGADGQVDTSLGQLVNKPRDTPTLPLTGGIGRDHFFIVGAVVALAGGSAALVIQIRRRRKEVA